MEKEPFETEYGVTGMVRERQAAYRPTYDKLNLICGYAGFKKFVSLKYTPDVIASINYEQEDATTESGFAESHVNVCTVHMEKAEEAVMPAGMTDKVTKLENDVSSITSGINEINGILEGE